MIRVEGSMKRTEKCLPGKKLKSQKGGGGPGGRGWRGRGVGHDNVIFLSGARGDLDYG